MHNNDIQVAIVIIIIMITWLVVGLILIAKKDNQIK